MEEYETIVSEQPPYVNELENCILRCPLEGRHNVLIHIQNTFQVELAPGSYKWTDRDHVSEYQMKNVKFSNIRYTVSEPDEFQDKTFWTWLHELVFGPPDVQTILLSFDVKQLLLHAETTTSESVRV